MEIPKPFRFPVAGCGTRRHGPKGYQEYQGYKDWLSDEFDFRCIYCLTRVRWERDPDRNFSVEHFTPKSLDRTLETAYSNLAFACMACNNSRGAQPLPIDPNTVPIGDHLKLKPNGEFEAMTAEGKLLQDLLSINVSTLVAFRRAILECFARAVGARPGATGSDFDKFRYPANLPDLATLRPPGGNDRESGKDESAFARRTSGTLPEFY